MNSTGEVDRSSEAAEVEGHGESVCTGAPLVLRPILFISARLSSAACLLISATLLLACCLALIHAGTARNVSTSVLILAYLVAGWWAWALRWRTRSDIGQVLTALEAIAQGTLPSLPETSQRGELASIGAALVAARRVLTTQQEELRSAHSARERQLQDSHDRQKASEGQVRQRAQAIIDETATAVVMELQGLIMQVDSVRRGAGAIEQ